MQAQQALGWMLTPAAAAISRRFGKVVLGGVSGGELKVSDLQALDAQKASQAKIARCAQWHSLFAERVLDE